MTMLKRLSGFFVVALMVSALGCATQSEPQSTGAYMGDSWITTKVKTAILNEPSLKVAEINVETFKGTVQLSGFVSHADNKRTAVQVARGVNGVKSVKDDMRVK